MVAKKNKERKKDDYKVYQISLKKSLVKKLDHLAIDANLPRQDLIDKLLTNLVKKIMKG